MYFMNAKNRIIGEWFARNTYLWMTFCISVFYERQFFYHQKRRSCFVSFDQERIQRCLCGGISQISFLFVFAGVALPEKC